MTTGERRPYKDMNDFICNAFELDPEKVQWAIDGWKMLKPSEPVPFDVAVAVGKKGDEARKALRDDPSLTPSQIAKRFDVTDRYARRIVAGTKAELSAEPKLLNRGANQHSGVDRSQKLDGNNKDYVVARLQRDGQQELADQVKAGMKSARQAAIEAGFKSPESQLTILKRWPGLRWIQTLFLFCWLARSLVPHRATLDNP